MHASEGLNVSTHQKLQKMQSAVGGNQNLSLKWWRLRFPSPTPHHLDTHKRCGRRLSGSWWCRQSSRRRTGTSSLLARRAPPLAGEKSRCLLLGQSDLQGHKDCQSVSRSEEGRSRSLSACKVVGPCDALSISQQYCRKDMKDEKQQFVCII